MAITVQQQGDRWVARFPWSVQAKDAVKAAGFRFDGAQKIWWTRDPAVAAKLGGDTTEAIARLNAERAAIRAREEASIEASRAAGSDFRIPLSEACRARGMDFLPYQRAGVEYAMRRKDALIADEMGLGKTLEAIGIINADPAIGRVLVICPASLKLNWAREAQLWLSRPMPVTIANHSMPRHGMVILNYEMVGKARAALDQVEWDLLICDESHYLKNPKAQRTAHVLGKWNADPSKRLAPIAAKRRVFLTGTPILNRPKELWTLLHSLDPQGLGRNWRQFHVRYCDGHQESAGRAGTVWNIDGASNLDELQAKLRASIMVRRLKSEVLTELPAKRRQIIALEPRSAEEKAAVAAEVKLVRENKETIARLRAALEALPEDRASAAYQEAVAELRAAQAVAFEEMSKVRHRIALAKVPQVLEHVTDCLDGSDGKLILWAHHHDVADQLTEGLGAFGVLKADGRDDVTDRDAAVQRFQSDPTCRVIVCGIAAMGVGHTMTAASHAVFAELDWVPGNLVQAEDRCHRIGQRNAVLVQHLVLDGSLDAQMAQVIVDKMGVIEAAVDDGGALPDQQPLEAPAEPVQRAKPDEPELPAAQVEAIHAALRLLAGMCDGAYALDGAGFNKVDSGFGKDLASRSWLTQGQARAARKMLVKYARQIPADLYAVLKGD